jgi:dihydrofolate reductase
MGKKTFFSLPENYRPLKNRLNIVLTCSPNTYLFDNYYNKFKNLFFTNNDKIYSDIFLDKQKFIDIYPFLNKDFKIIIIGGKNVYEKYIQLCEKVWLTKFKNDYNCDLFFNYNFDNLFKENILEDNEELQIIKYEKINLIN